MIAVRPAEEADMEGLMRLAEQAGLGMTTMPQSEAGMLKRIQRSENAFAAETAGPSETFFLVMEEENRVTGMASIFTNLGYDRPFYSYRLSHIANESPEMNIRANADVLHLVNDLHGYTEIGTLFVDPKYRNAGRGRMMSLSRFVLMAVAPERFDENVSAEIRGYSDAEDRFPFWDAIGSRFFHISFTEADRRSANDYHFIADLMPKYPIYVSLLSAEAQAIIGKPHPLSARAMKMLEAQGFRWNRVVDIFDGGPTVETRRDQIETIRNSRKLAVRTGAEATTGDPMMVASCNVDRFRMITVLGDAVKDAEVVLSESQIAALGIEQSDSVIVSALYGGKS